MDHKLISFGITLIAGQNGTQKSTLLGILSQTFTIPRENHSFSDEVPLTGGNFRSAFQDKFRLSPELDKAGNHEWTLYFHNPELHQDLSDDNGFTVESLPRSNNKLRFWQKGKREAGSGYIHLPVIFLSLKRLIPIAEAGNVTSKDIKLTQEERDWFSRHYNTILFTKDELQSIDYLESNNKNTLGVTTNHYDWHSNSAGQDNLGKILLAIISFYRLKEKYPNEYEGGILAIDEIDATLYPGSQVKLLELFSKLCKNANMQLIATTHSLQLLEKISELKRERGRLKQFNTVYLKKIDGIIQIEESPEFERIVNNLNVTMGKSPKVKKITVYTEDQECIHYVKAIIGRKFKNLDFPQIKLGCGNLIELAAKKVPSFTFPNSIVVLDGDAQDKIKKRRLKNFLCLPGELNPESMLANFLHQLSDASPFWTEKNPDYSKQICFESFSLANITSNRVTAKKWYNQQLETGVWGRQACLVFKYYLESIKENKKVFSSDFEKLYNKIAHN